MKTILHTSSLTRSIRVLLGAKSRPNAHQRMPNSYYRNVYIPKGLYEGIDLVARIEHISKKKATELLLESGFSRYMGEKLKEYVENEQNIKELNLKRHPYPTRFVKVLKKFCEERGIDTRKII